MRTLTAIEKEQVYDSIRGAIEPFVRDGEKVTDEGIQHIYETASQYIGRVKGSLDGLGLRMINAYIDHGHQIPSEYIVRTVSVPVPEITVDNDSDMSALQPLVDYIESRVKAPANTEDVKAEIDSAVNKLGQDMTIEIQTVVQALRQEIADAKETAVNVLEVRTPKETHRIEGLVHEKLATIIAYVSVGEPVFLYGRAGTGKSHIAEQVAEALGIDYYPANSVQTKYDITGYNNANGEFVKTPFFDAFTKGGLYFVDEMDNSAPDALIVLNTAVANGYCEFANGVQKAHPDFRIMGAGNTVGKGATSEYCGRNQLDGATIDRFAFVEIDYDRRIELATAGGDEELVEFIHQFRKACEDNGIFVITSYRAIKRLHAIASMLPLAEVIKTGLLKGMETADIQTIYDSLPASRYKKAMASLI